ncbi:peptidoglycan bridge formation glycyltransferase FemA/FemB family protein, partial [Staphylococcus hominis]|uniref:peptidoglycan bridge formation glycyltransferase FemA/FemB family protein n=1 Tax=Staphylococcus hominis TaxID=1290 RepID=UPI0011A494BC
MGVKVKRLAMEERHSLLELLEMGEEKDGFKFRDEGYLYEMEKRYKDDAMLKLPYMDLKDYLCTVEDKDEDLTKQVSEIEEGLKERGKCKKKKNKSNEHQQEIDRK